jgi:poly(3-hydroxybutyrate) depolymerase
MSLANVPARGFIMVWPNGVGNSWNVGRCCGIAQSHGVDDVAFTRAIISNLLTNACIDPKRVYASGCSNGGAETGLHATESPMSATSSLARGTADLLAETTLEARCSLH